MPTTIGQAIVRCGVKVGVGSGSVCLVLTHDICRLDLRDATDYAGKHVYTLLSLSLRVHTHSQKFESETVYRIKEKFHPCLNKAFEGVGVVFADGKMHDTKLEAVARAMGRVGNADPILKVISVLTENPHLMLECSKDSYGNYTTQDLIDAAGKMRWAVATHPAVSVALSGFKADNRGMDPLAAMISALLPNVDRALATHATGTYILQKLTEPATPHEVCVYVRLGMQLTERDTFECRYPEFWY